MKTIRLIIIIIIIILSAIHIINDNDGLIYIKAELDNEYYLVRDEKDKINAANFLAKLKQNMFILSENLHEKVLKKSVEVKEY